jgi:hypothetical protein
MQMLLGERLEVRRRGDRREGAGAGEAEGGPAGEGATSQGEGSGGGEEDEEEEGERDWLLHVEGSEEEAGAETLRRMAPGECSLM